MIAIAKWLIPVLLPAAGWSARYTPLEFSHMAVAASLIVHGEIVEVREDTFILDVEDADFYGTGRLMDLGYGIGKVLVSHDWEIRKISDNQPNGLMASKAVLEKYTVN